MGQNLISSQTFVQVPVIRVKIGDYEFGFYKEDKKGYKHYPNYIQSLSVTKINGQVNTYELELNYPITQEDDPNYFEKIFSSVSQSRAIEFTYGDAAVPNFLYKSEKALITDIKTHFKLESSQIGYTISAISKGALGLTGNYPFPAVHDKPSNVIRSILIDPQYGLQDLFTGMRNITLVDTYGLIPHTDTPRDIEAKKNISVLEYLQYLVDLMNPDVGEKEVAKDTIYILTFVDDTTDIFGGSYFKIATVDSAVEHPEAYQLDIGFPGSNYVFNFNVENDENYSILYNYQKELHPQEWVIRINEDGDYEEVYAPILSSSNSENNTGEEERAWWSKITKYPIKASLDIKGLLRPAILMTYVRLNIYLYGKKHINSGLYIITKQVDRVDGNGYKTTLNLNKISGD